MNQIKIFQTEYLDLKISSWEFSAATFELLSLDLADSSDLCC
jgi:hypothetical protein